MAKITETDHPVKAFGWAARDESGILSPFKFSRRATGEREVQFKVLYCGICRSDLQMVKNEWGYAKYPFVPGHEIVGIVTEVGTKAGKFKVGDKVGVGYMIGSCRNCDQCNNDLENYCPKQLLTYVEADPDGPTRHGGYSNVMIVDERYAVLWPENLPLDVGAPLLGAGITVYSPLRFFGLDRPGLNVGVVGLGGMGHLAVKFAKAFGGRVTVISSSLHKKEEAIEKLGADEFLYSHDSKQMQGATRTLDGILDTVAKAHPIEPILNLLKHDGKFVLVGVPEKALDLPSFPLIVGRRSISGTNFGSVKETQEMVDFAAKHGIFPEVEIIPIQYVNIAMDRLSKSDVKYRFVIDIANSLKEAE